MSKDPNTKKINGSCSAIQVLFQKAQEICKSDQVVSSAEQLEELEQKVCDLTDQLQAIIIEERLQSSLDSEEVRETEADLVANLPWKLKNKGLRDVVITLRCGVTIVVRIPYYVGKKKHKPEAHVVKYKNERRIQKKYIFFVDFAGQSDLAVLLA